LSDDVNYNNDAFMLLHCTVIDSALMLPD